MFIRPRKKLYVSCNGQNKNRVCMLVKKNSDYFFVQRCVLFAFFMLIGSWKGVKNLRVGIFLSKNFLW